MSDATELIEKSLNLRKLKEELDQSDSMAYIGEKIDSLSEADAKQLLRMYVFDR
jgi:hypothetical protein